MRRLCRDEHRAGGKFPFLLDSQIWFSIGKEVGAFSLHPAAIVILVVLTHGVHQKPFRTDLANEGYRIRSSWRHVFLDNEIAVVAEGWTEGVANVINTAVAHAKSAGCHLLLVF